MIRSVQKKPMSQTTYVATAPVHVVDRRGNVKVLPVGSKLSARAWAALPSDHARAKFSAVTRAPRAARAAGAGVKVSDRAVLGFLLDQFDRGLTLGGGYGAVWATVTSALDLDPSWAHYRAAQLARVGRAFECATGVSFAALCPGLPAVAGDWVSAL